MSDLNNYKYNNVSLGNLLATTKPAINVTAVTADNNVLKNRFNINKTFYKANQDDYTGIKCGITNYSVDGTTISTYLPHFIQYDEEVQINKQLDVSNYDTIYGFLVGGGGGGGGGGANREGNNSNGGDGAWGQVGQSVEFDLDVSNNNYIYINVGGKGGAGTGGGNRENRPGNSGNQGFSGGTTSIEYGTRIISAVGGGGGNGGGGGSSGDNGDGGNTHKNYTEDTSVFNGNSNLARNAGSYGGRGNSGSFPTPGGGGTGSNGSALIFLVKT